MFELVFLGSRKANRGGQPPLRGEPVQPLRAERPHGSPHPTLATGGSAGMRGLPGAGGHGLRRTRGPLRAEDVGGKPRCVFLVCVSF